MERVLELICDECGKPIDDGTGFLWVDHSEVNQTERAIRERESARTGPDGGQAFDINAFMEMPASVRWQSHHHVCNPKPDASSYGIAAEKIRTWRQLLEWTSHLMGKVWLSRTDWEHVLLGVHNGTTRLIAVTVDRSPDQKVW
ncbi:hypothetical protein [Streptomyces mayteni]